MVRIVDLGGFFVFDSGFHGRVSRLLAVAFLSWRNAHGQGVGALRVFGREWDAPRRSRLNTTGTKKRVASVARLRRADDGAARGAFCSPLRHGRGHGSMPSHHGHGGHQRLAATAQLPRGSVRADVSLCAAVAGWQGGGGGGGVTIRSSSRWPHRRPSGAPISWALSVVAGDEEVPR